MSSPKIDVAALAKLARLEISKKEEEKLEKELPEILKFVEAIQGADTSGVKESKQLRNVMRDDTSPHESAIYTEKLLEQAPAREGNRVAVKQVISRKK